MRLLAALALALAWLTVSAHPAGAAPRFHLFDQQGRMVSLAEFAGRPVVLFFWASWSAQPDSSLALFQSHGQSPAVLLAIDESVTEEEPAAVRARVQAMHLGIAVLFDDLGEAADALGVHSLPAVVALDASHKVVYRKTGALSADTMERAVRAATGRRSALRTGPSPAFFRPS